MEPHADRGSRFPRRALFSRMLPVVVFLNFVSSLVSSIAASRTLPFPEKKRARIQNHVWISWFLFDPGIRSFVLHIKDPRNHVTTSRLKAASALPALVIIPGLSSLHLSLCFCTYFGPPPPPHPPFYLFKRLFVLRAAVPPTHNALLLPCDTSAALRPARGCGLAAAQLLTAFSSNSF